MLKKVHFLFVSLLITALSYGQISQVIRDNMQYNNNYIGGYIKADISSGLSFKQKELPVDLVVRDAEELLRALKLTKRKSMVIYLDDNSVFDLSGIENIILPPNFTLCSGRGINSSQGALIISKSLKTNPLFTTGGNFVKIMGIRIQGPDEYIINPSALKKYMSNKSISQVNNILLRQIDKKTKKNLIYGIGNSRAIEVKHSGILIENCEISGWSHAGISVRGGSVSIRYNYIYNNQRLGLGYGIMIDRGKVNARANIFMDNRHAIAGTGNLGTSYTAEYNIVYANKIEQGHQFDMHGGRDRGEINNIAGSEIEIRNNIVLYKNGPSVLIRGNPEKAAIIEDNLFIRVIGDRLVKINEKNLGGKRKSTSNHSSVIKQTYGTLRLQQKNNSFIELDN